MAAGNRICHCFDLSKVDQTSKCGEIRLKPKLKHPQRPPMLWDQLGHDDIMEDPICVCKDSWAERQLRPCGQGVSYSCILQGHLVGLHTEHELAQPIEKESCVLLLTHR
ncbi:hypothetical protein Pyn_30654 [Prunus yedoensis var. nudiflora]|uniref:Uncharacterized protein n=1 Tax=Prunus yedoensis var. nudiflora TaxID=2094558 RepID=A0A314XWV4_PRUYE|nr:hypothetical protein Pyn_30654 [Prunus yedoensis var. nudiflora]